MSTTKRIASSSREHDEDIIKKSKAEEELKPDSVDTLEKEDNYDFLFDQEDDFDLAAFETAEKNAESAKLDLSKWQRCTVIRKWKDEELRNALVLNVSGKVKIEGGDEQEAECKCYLLGPWCETKVMENSIVSLKGIWDEGLQAYKVDKDQGFCVTNPDLLINGTTVVSSLFCPRKTVLLDRFKGLNTNSRVMVIGSLVHEILQTVLEKGIKKPMEIEKVAVDLLNSRETAILLYTNQLTQANIMSEIMNFVSSIYQFVQQYVEETPTTSFPIPNESFQGRIVEINDIEESLWIPHLGVKGKIDVSVKIHPRRQRGQIGNLMDKTEKIVPLELKTGRASFSMEHQGQLILYQMMLTSIGQPTDSGLLLYLRENLMREIKSSRNEQRDLIFLRNDISNYLVRASKKFGMPSEIDLPRNKFVQPLDLPEPISHHKACAECPCATECCSFAKTDPSIELEYNHQLLEFTKEAVMHLKLRDMEYFIKWTHLLMLEDREAYKSDNISDLWCSTPESRQRNARAICYLKISQQPIEKEESHFKHQFVLENHLNDSVTERQTEDNIDLTLSGFSVGEYVIVSTTNRLAVASGFVLELTSSAIMLNLERDLQKKYKQERFIIDKYNSKSGNTFNFTNLGMLNKNTERSNSLRNIIIWFQPPSYQMTLDESIQLQAVEMFSPLNTRQRNAIIKAVTTTTYALIKGLPGTGKTETLVILVRLLRLLNKTVLITSHTHSAVDNLLLRLKAYNLPFIRLGSSARVNPQLKDYSEAVLTANCKNEAVLAQVYNSYPIVGVTCLGSGHPIFLHRTFDYCIVDEAAQIMQPTILRPLFFAQHFVLVGDPQQLPPLLKSAEARRRGGCVSLFERLDSEGATSVLTTQYRMNKTITKLANNLTYRGSLECAKTVESATMDKPINPDVKDKWLQRVLQTHVDQSVFFLDTLDCSERSFNYAKAKHSATCSLIETAFNEQALELTVESPSKSSERLSKYTNYCEAALVFKILNALLISKYKPERIGIIAPYRAQVELLRKLALQHHEYYLNLSEEKYVACDYSAVEINTVDQYQGRDKEIIIYSCCRTGSTSSQTEHNRDAEILEDQRRLTVAITRSKHKLIIIGDSACIQQYTPFKALLGHIPGLCKLKLEDNKLGFQWSQVMDSLSDIINGN